MKTAIVSLAGAALLAVLSTGCSNQGQSDGGTGTTGVPEGTSSGTGSSSSGSSSSSGGTRTTGSSGGSGTSSATTSSGSTGSSNSHSSSSSGSSSGGTSGSCEGATQGELEPCQTTADCMCLLSCVNDPVFEGTVCEGGCSTNADCGNPGTACQHSLCQAIGCTDYDGLCDAVGTDDGTCLPFDDADGGRVGVCQQGGTAPLFGCDFSPSRANLPGLCPAGSYCWSEGYSDPAAPDTYDTVCRPMCNPLTTTTCANGGVCAYGLELDDGTAYGSPDQAFGLCSLAIPLTGSGFVQGQNQVFAQVPNGGGGVIASPQLVTITFQGDPLQQTDEAWGAWAVQSQDWLGVVGADYGVGLGSVVSNVEIAGPPPALALTDTESYLVQQIQSGVVPSPPAQYSNYLYIVYFPSNVQVVSQSVGVGCQDWSGYHDELSSGTLDFAYAVIADCPPYDNGAAEAENVEATAAHELIEMATDPFFETTNGAYYVADPTSAWSYDDLGQEVADLCVVNTTDITVFDGGFAAQRIWSNSLAAAAVTSPCAPIPSGEIYSNVVIPTSEAAQLGPGGSVTFPVLAWSNAPLEWPVNVVQTSAAPPTLGMTLNLPPAVFNGTQGTLMITVPASTALGTVVSVELESQSAAQYAYWPIAISVPMSGVTATAPIGCTVPTDGGVDPCLASGTVCIPPAGAISLDGVCQLPNELNSCLASVGCSGVVDCLTTTDGGICLQSCSQNGDCLDPTTACQTQLGQQACWPNACGPGTSNGSVYYASCNATATNDGTCIPAGASGLCLANGPVASGDSCQWAREDGGTEQLCVAGDLCVASSEGRTSSLCEPLCGVDGGAPTCATGEACAPVLGNGVGACTQVCADGGPACPVNTACTLIPPGNDWCSW